MARPAADTNVTYERVRVERNNGDLITLYNARFAGDSIKGFQGVREYSLPLAGIKVVETNQLDKGQTTAAAVVGLVVAGIFALMISFLFAIGGE
jgi:ABC-type phosphate/phosphonate transport system permease subunit